MNIREAAEELQTKMWRTAGARFNCVRRLKIRNTLSACTISIVSVYLIGIAIYQKLYAVEKHCPNFDTWLAFVSIMGAMLIIVLSLLDWASDFSVNALRLFDNATEIRKLHNRLRRALIEGQTKVDLTDEYDAVLNLYEALNDRNSPNHDLIDDLLFRAQNPREPHMSFQLSRPARLIAYAWWCVSAYGLYVLILVGIPLALYSVAY